MGENENELTQRKSGEHEKLVARLQEEKIATEKYWMDRMRDMENELNRRKRASGGATRIVQLEAKVKKLEAENMALERELGEVLEMLSDHESEEEEVDIEDNSDRDDNESLTLNGGELEECEEEDRWRTIVRLGTTRVRGKWVSDKGECAIFRDNVTGHLSYEEPVGDNRLHGLLVAQKDREASAPCWHAQLSILQENEHPRYGLSFGEKPEYVGDIQVRLLPGEGIETRIKFMDEDGVKDSDWQPPTFWARKEEMSDKEEQEGKEEKDKDKDKKKKKYSWDAQKAREERTRFWRGAFKQDENVEEDYK